VARVRIPAGLLSPADPHLCKAPLLERRRAFSKSIPKTLKGGRPKRNQKVFQICRIHSYVLYIKAVARRRLEFRELERNRLGVLKKSEIFQSRSTITYFSAALLTAFEQVFMCTPRPSTSQCLRRGCIRLAPSPRGLSRLLLLRHTPPTTPRSRAGACV